MTKYAEGTDVPAERSRAEIDRLITKAGATKFSYGREEDREVIVFQIKSWFVKFTVATPKAADKNIRQTPTGLWRSDKDVQSAIEREIRRRWRALLLVIKARLEAVESGIETMEQAFLAHVMLPDGRQVSEAITPVLVAAYETGKTPALLAAHIESKEEIR